PHTSACIDYGGDFEVVLKRLPGGAHAIEKLLWFHPGCAQAAGELDIERWRQVAFVKATDLFDRVGERLRLRHRSGRLAKLVGREVREAEEQVCSTHHSRVLDLRPFASEHTVLPYAEVRANYGEADLALGPGPRPVPGPVTVALVGIE